ncbi:MAG: hypothetical protein R3Y24_08920 [Eubacteriales bacterium]
MADEIIRLGEEDYLGRLTAALRLMGFTADLVESEEYPISIEADVLGYEEEGIQMTALFLPMEDYLGQEVQLLQIYFSLFDDVPEESYAEVERVCNFYNTSSTVGVFGVQEGLEKVCYKQAVALRGARGMEGMLNVAMDTIVLMALNLDRCYDALQAAVEGASFEDLIQSEE